MAATFISYRRDDSAGYAGRLCESLERRLGDGAVFRDVDAIEPGQDFVHAITARLSECRVFIALIGREWLEARDAAGNRRLDQPNDYVRLEIAVALQRPDVLVVPVLVEEAEMPGSESLPGAIRALSRRHAVTLRDETWDEDVDRLAGAIDKAGTKRTPKAAARSRWPVWTALAIAAIAALFFARMLGGDRASDPPSSGRTGAHAIPIPRVAEVAHGSVIYTLLSGNVVPNGNVSTVRLRVRFSNEGTTDANFWNASFRLVAGDQVIAPSGDLNEVVARHSLQQGIVTFDIRPTVRKAVLEVRQQDETGEVPLDLSRTGEPPVDERADAGDALSRAIIRPVLREATPLLKADDLSMTLAGVTARRFVNKLHIFVATRLSNGGRYPVHSGAVTLRLLADGEVKAPTLSPNEVLDGNTSKSLDYVFEVAPSTKRATLRAAAGNASRELPLELP